MKLKDKEHQKEQSASAKIHGKEVAALTKNLKVSTLHVLKLMITWTSDDIEASAGRDGVTKNFSLSNYPPFMKKKCMLY